MSGALQRGFKALECLAEHPQGCSVSMLAQTLDIPMSAAHRLLAEMVGCGYVRQTRDHGDYVLTIKLVSLGLSMLSSSGVVDLAQPLLDRLASESGELVRLAVVDGDELIFVAKAQGATRGLRYDPDMGLSVKLSCSAAGHAWLSALSEERALELLAKQGLGKPQDFGPRAPTTIKAVLALVRAARKRGFSMIVEAFAPAMTAMAAPVLSRSGETLGVVTIAGPMVRLSEARMLVLGAALMQAAQDVALASAASPMFKARSG